ncbi:MAG: FmdB family transcriptional regulator [Actinomycetia bacterium]|nr:FmdB family transcriptional regulator [Actinomycetes bacterium]
MPTYQYRCTACAEPLEAVQSFDDDPLTVCPSCGGPLRKVFSPVGVVFKGSGFYRTDSRDKGTKKAAGRAEKPAAAAEKPAPAKPAESASSTAAAPSTGTTPSTG